MSDPTRQGPPAPLSPVRQRLAAAWLVLSQLLGLAALVPWLGVAGLSLMAFDSGPELKAGPWLLLLGIWLYPLLLLVGSALAWLAFRKGRRVLALVTTSIPLLIPLAFYFLLASRPG